MFDLDIPGAIKSLSGIIDDVWTSDEEQAKMDLEDKKIDASIATGQMDINKAEAQHKSLFVAGWRPAVGWICALGMGYEFIVRPLLGWAWKLLQAKAWIPETLDIPSGLPMEALMTVLMGMLGLAGYRTYEKKKGVAANAIKTAVPEKKNGWFRKIFP